MGNLAQPIPASSKAQAFSLPIALKSVRAASYEARTAMAAAEDTLTPMATIDGTATSSCKVQPPSLKRIVLNPRAYLTPFVLFILGHDVPIVLAYILLSKPVGYAQCARLQDLFQWLYVAFILHLILACMMLATVVYTLTTRVYHERRPEGWLILCIFVGYWATFGWSLYGEAALRADTSGCGDTNWEQIQHCATTIASLQHFDVMLSFVIVMVGACTSYMCGVHSGDDAAEAEKRWQKRCMCCFHAFTCHKTVENEGDDDVFETLGRVLGKFFVVRYKTNRYEGLSFTDLKFSLDLVAKVQKKEREGEAARKAELAAQNVPTAQHFAPEEEEARLRDVAFYCRFAIGIYGWPMYVWYSPCFWFRIFGCFQKPHDDQVVEHDNFVHGNRASFVRYTGVHEADLVYLNCYNFVFQAPYCIVKDKARKELILSVRGSMSFYDFVTDGLAQIVRMDPSELPDDIPYAFDTRTHYGMLQTARQIFKSLQEGTRKAVFWDFAMAHCTHQRLRLDDWRVVVCGHSMGAGVACILAILLRKVFPATKAYLYAVPPLFDPETAVWTKTFATTVVYGDDIVPRLSIANMTRLRDEMAIQYDAVANEPLYRIKFGLYDACKGVPQPLQPTPRSHEALPRLPTVVEATTSPRTGTSTETGSGSCLNNSLMNSLTPTDFGSARANVIARPSRVLSNNTLISLPQEDSSQEVDVPGEIVHIQTVKLARRCGCTMFLGEQKMQYTLQDASYFRRIWVTPRSLQDHMVHHYDRKIRYLVTDCMEFETPVAAHRPSASASTGVSWMEDSDHDSKGTTPQTDYKDIDAIALHA